jgi:hypothetical protein
MCIPPIVARQTLNKMYLSFIARQRLGEHIAATNNTHNNIRIVGRMCLLVCVYPPVVAR